LQGAGWLPHENFTGRVIHLSIQQEKTPRHLAGIDNREKNHVYLTLHARALRLPSATGVWPPPAGRVRLMSALRYSLFLVSAMLTVVTGMAAVFAHLPWYCVVLPAVFTAIGIHDVSQTRHSILRNYPILGHLRFLLESIRPEIRQYFFDDDIVERPFSRMQRSVVYQRAKNELDSRAFGTELDVRVDGHEWISHSMAPTKIASQDFRVVVGAGLKRPYAISVFNISAMSFGALSANAIRALNRGAKLGGFAHDTGEGSLSKYHRENGGDIIYQVASGYFGCRKDDGTFDPQKFAEIAALEQVKMIEVKLSQGAKPGHGGVLPAGKVTQEIAETRGVPMGQDCVSPSNHSEFKTPAGLLRFVKRLRTLADGKPVGLKMCIGHAWELLALVKAMLETGIVPDFIVVDGAEGGTGAAPMEFADHVGMPLQEGLLLVHNTLVGAGLRDRIRIGASGKAVTAFDIARNLALGADWTNSARAFMFAIGCIQSLSCNSGRCPTGVATQDPDRQKALIVPDKAERVHSYHRNTLHALKELLEAAGLNHPSELRPYHIVRRLSSYSVKPLSDLLDYLEPNDLLNGNYRFPVYEKYWSKVSGASFAMPATLLSTETHRNTSANDDAGENSKMAAKVIWLQSSGEIAQTPEVDAAPQGATTKQTTLEEADSHPA
jgi:glutamate synthase domain-containing protein 2